MNRYLKQYSVPFNAEVVSRKVATSKLKDSGLEGEELEFEIEKLAEQLRKNWDSLAVFGRDVGDFSHDYIEKYISGERFHRPKMNNEDQARIKVATMNIRLFLRFLKDNLHLTILVAECPVIDKELGLYGKIDAVAWDSEKEELVLLDWKFNRKFKMQDKWKKLLPPYEQFDQCHWNEYSLQLNMYRHILRKNGIEVGSCYLVHFHAESATYKMIETNERIRFD